MKTWFRNFFAMTIGIYLGLAIGLNMTIIGG